ncbi:MAG: signal recognition particle protein [Cytophagales bacterium]|nr:signal recognition particle protein [Armatimonadota bacterium]
MFEQLAEKLQNAFKKLRGNAKLSEAEVDAALREVRLALLEADVNFKVVKDFVARVKERAVGDEILDGLNPAQQVVKIVHEEMIRLLAGDDEASDATDDGVSVADPEAGEITGVKPRRRAKPVKILPTDLVFASKAPSVLMLCGLQGAGKTTLAGKLAAFLKKQGKTPVLAACDVQRPAAIKQLQIVGEQVKAPVFTIPGADPVRIAREAVEWAKANRADVVILDTAGRLHVDDDLMEELQGIKEATQPSDILLVLDAMTGQDAVNVAVEFNDAINVGGFVLTKVDGDARGGAAISVRAVVGKPIKLVGVGEKMTALEVFYPDRMASRILGMGDVLSLIEKAEAAIDEKTAAEMEKKLRQGKFDFEDFLSQMQQMRRLGPMRDLLAMLPGVGTKLKDVDFDAGEKEMARFEAIVRSMTKEERRRPETLNGARRKRVAAGSGTTVQEVNKVLTNFNQMRDMMKMMASGKMPGMPGGGGGRMAPMPGLGGGVPAARKNKKGKGGGGGGPKFRLPFGR